jgi:group I intron endonuclease
LNIEFKTCCRCKQDLPKTLEYFGPDKSTKDGLKYTCRKCRGGKYVKQVKDGFKLCNKCGDELPATTEYFDIGRRNIGGLIPICKACKHQEYLERKPKIDSAAKRGVYKITNLINGKIYIGSTKNIHIRKNEHFSSLKSGRHVNKELQDDFNSQNGEGFDFKFIEEVKKVKDLISRELFWMKELNSTNPCKGYNIVAPIKNTGISRPVSEEECKRRSERLKNRYFSPEHRAKISKAISGDKHWLYGKPTPLEVKKKLSIANMGRNIGEKCGTSKLKETEVIQIKTEFKQGFSDLEIAYRFNVSRSNINAIRRGISWKHVIV